MKHLTPDELIELLDKSPTTDAHQHLDACAGCRAQFEALSLAMQSAREVDVPEPSPLFWEHFSARVRTAVDAEASPAREWPQWFRLPVLAPLAGLAILIGALAVTLPRSPGPLPVEVAESLSNDILLSEDGWTLVADAVGDLDWDTATEAGLIVEPGAVDRVVMELNADEQRELTALLHAELRTKS